MDKYIKSCSNSAQILKVVRKYLEYCSNTALLLSRTEEHVNDRVISFHSVIPTCEFKAVAGQGVNAQMVRSTCFHLPREGPEDARTRRANDGETDPRLPVNVEIFA